MEPPIVCASECEVRAVIRFLCARKVGTSEIYRQLCEVYGANVMSIQMVRRWKKIFEEGRTNVHDDTRDGRPRESLNDDSIAGVRALLDNDRRLTIREVELKMNSEMGNRVSRMTIARIIRDYLKLRKVSARWVPRDLTDEHKKNRMGSALTFLTRYHEEGEQFLSRIVTGDETWIHHYTPTTKKDTMVWKTAEERPPKKFKTFLSAGKVMCTAFWDQKGVLLEEFLPSGNTINAQRYCETLKKLRTAIKNKRPGLLTRGVVLMHDNARPHSARITQELLQTFKWDVFSHPPYSPDLAPSDFFLFPLLKKNLGGKKFDSNEEVIAFTHDFFRNLDGEKYRTGLGKLLPRYEKCLYRQGDYVEK